MKLTSIFLSLFKVVSLALVATASAIPVSDSVPTSDANLSLHLDTANATALNNTTLASLESTLIARADTLEEAYVIHEPYTRVYVLPFHLRVNELCALGTKFVLVDYSNGNIARKNIPINHHEIVAIAHLAPTFPHPIQLGPYNFEKSRMRLNYKTCTWNDDQPYKMCGECRPGGWSSDLLDCKDTKATSRHKDMDCSFILAKQGWEP